MIQKLMPMVTKILPMVQVRILIIKRKKNQKPNQRPRKMKQLKRKMNLK